MKGRYAAVLMADVAGYSRLMEAHEQDTHRQLTSVRAEVLAPALATHRGTVVKRTGDGFLAIFDHALDAVRCAIEIQDGVARHEAALPPDRAIRFRIGINVGEIIVEDDDVYGNDVNVAARLQDLTEPGGVLISAATRDAAGADLPVRVVDLGLLALKNMDRPVQGFRLALAPAAPRTSPASAVPISRPSIAVLPFRCLDEDQSSAYFGAGIVEEIVASLASLRELSVASRSASIAIQTIEPDPARAGKRLGVRYTLAGTVRRSENRIRVTTELADVESGYIEWAHRFDFPPEELFKIQDRITAETVGCIAPQILKAEIGHALRKRPESMTAHDFVLQAQHLMYRLQRDEFARAGTLLRRAIALDDSYAAAYAYAAEWHGLLVGQGWSPNPANDMAEVIRLAEAAIDRDHGNSLALAMLGHHRSFLYGEYDSAMALFDRALEANPGSSRAWGLSAPTFTYIGNPEAAISRAQQALRLAPLDQWTFWYRTTICNAHYTLGDYEKAVEEAQAALAQSPRYTAVLRPLATALAALGRRQEAHAVTQRLLALDPNFQATAYAAAYPYRNPKDRARLLQHLIDAGLSA